MEEDGGAIGRETRRRLLEWWTREYCASRMRLCVIGRESLDELAEMVVPLFSPVVNRGQVGLPMFTEHPFGPNESGTAVAVQTIMDIHLVEISFPFPWQPPYWEHAPANFLSHFLGHEGPGSLHSYLKKKGWITMLNAGPQNLARGFAMFKATIHLTKDGFKNYREIILATCKYLTLLRTSQFSPWQQQELCLLARTRFQFQEKNRVDDYAQWISDHMSWPVPKENVLSAAQLIAEWGPEGREEADVRQMLDYLQLNKGRAILMAQGEELETLGENGKWQSEPIYGTQFRVERFDEAFLKEALGPNDIKELFLPGPNEFIPKNLDVDKKEITEPAKRPFLIRQTSHSTLWHKKDDTFWVPKSSALINIHSAQVNTSARANVKTRLWTQLVMDSLNEYGYDAELAGLRYHVSADARGVGVALGGYNDKLPVLAHHVLERLRNIKIDPERLAVIKESTKREWQNVFLRETYWIAMLYEAYVLSKDQWSMEEKLQELSDITTEEIQQHVQDVMARTFTEMLLVGNVHKEEALEFAEVVERTIGSAPLDPEAVADRALIIPQGSNYVWSTAVQNPNESNSALLYFMHVGDGNDARTRVISALLSQLLSEPAFNTLRTKEQLGYIVSCSQEVLARGTQVGVKFLVQSERQPAYLEERVELFLEDMSGRIAEMDDAEFEQQKESLVRKWREKLKNTREEANRYWKYIDAGNLDFCRRDNDAVLLERVTKADVLALYGAKIHPSSPTRGKLSVHLLAQKAQSKKASATALSAFDGILRDAGVPTEGGAWKEQVAGDAEPLLSDVTKYWQARLAAAPAVSAEKAQELLGKLAMLADEHPAESAYEGKLRDSVVLVDDVKAFKAILEVAPSPKPVVEWGDLPVSKL